jgi:hypothetical protein
MRHYRAHGPTIALLLKIDALIVTLTLIVTLLVSPIERFV